MRRVMVFVVAGLLLLHAAAGAMAAEPGDNAGAEAEFTSLIAEERANRGLSTLTTSQDLAEVARRHAQRMAEQNDLHHNQNIHNEVEDWQLLGENVGRGANVQQVHDAFMASSSHRAQIVEPRYEEIGVGAIWSNGEIWVVQVFRKRQAPPPPPQEDDPALHAASAGPEAPAPPPASASVPAPPVATQTSAPAPAPAAPSALAEPAVFAPDLNEVGAVLATPVVAQPDISEIDLEARAISTVPLAEGIPLVAELAAGLLLLIVAMQTVTLRRLGLV